MTRWSACAALVLLPGLVSCAKMEGCVQLEGDYRLWIVSASERYITKQDDVYLLGPRIESMAIDGGVIFGFNPEYKHYDMRNVPGYFILDTLRAESDTGLGETEFRAKLQALGIADYELAGPGEIMKRRLDTHRCPDKM